MSKISLERDKTHLKRIEVVSELPADAPSQVFMISSDALIRECRRSRLAVEKIKSDR